MFEFVIGFIIGGVLACACLWFIVQSKIKLRIAQSENQAEKQVAVAENQVELVQEQIKNLQQQSAKLEQELQAEKSQHKETWATLAQTQNNNASYQASIKALEEQILKNQENITDLKVEKDSLRDSQELLKAALAAKEKELEEQKKSNEEKFAMLAEVNKKKLEEQEKSNREKFEILEEANQKKLALLLEAREELSNQFKALASDILDEKTKKFTEQNKLNLDTLLKPLASNLGEFKDTVEKHYVQEGKDRSALQEQVQHLMQLNQRVSNEANNLARTLKGEVKKQGMWGEYVLEQLLENAGLIKEQHYDVQKSYVLKNGTRYQPDAVLYLPDKKHLIVDAKTSLLAYDEYVNAEEESEREKAGKRLLQSIRSHFIGLSAKEYQSIPDLQTQDYVIMFLPLEPAYILAMSLDRGLWEEAWKKNVLLVSPSLFLFAVRTVAHSWRMEDQKQNAQEIAQRGEALYDKFVNFVADLQDVGQRLGQAQKSYDSALNKLSEGRGNLISQASKLQELGLKPKKTLPDELLSLATSADIEGQ